MSPTPFPRRGALGAMALTALGWACNGPAAPAPKAPPAPKLPDLHIAALTDLLTAVRLKWLIRIQPQALRSVEWIKTSLAPIIRDERLELLARMTGVDLRVVPEIVLAGYRGESADGDGAGDGGDGDGAGSGGGGGGGDAIAYFVRHGSDPLIIERKFRGRLTGSERRSAHGHQLVGAWGNIGTTPRGFVAIGPDVAGYQYGGSRQRGPGRIALLYAQGKLAGVPTVLADPSLAVLHAALAGAQRSEQPDAIPPLEMLMPGPFEGDLAHGARGLLAASSGMGAVLAPTTRRSLRLLLLIAGDYGNDSDRDEAVRLLGLAWQDLATSDLGHLLGLATPIAAAKPQAVALGLGLLVELDAKTLFDGLAAATVASVREIMR